MGISLERRGCYVAAKLGGHLLYTAFGPVTQMYRGFIFSPAGIIDSRENRIIMVAVLVEEVWSSKSSVSTSREGPVEELSGTV